MSSASVTLAVQCRYCGKPVTLLCETRPAPLWNSWDCPHEDCATRNQIEVPGIVVYSWPGHQGGVDRV